MTLDDVSRETLQKLDDFVALVQKWNPRINLISRISEEDIWERHIRDSLQLCEGGISAEHWADLGSGGGFPGIVVAICASPSMGVTLIESDQRKSAFLRTAARELDLNVTVISERIEKVEPLMADIVSARALAEVKTLLGYAHLHLSSSGTAIFPKGAEWQKDLAEAEAHWSYRCEVIKSSTNPSAAILKFRDIARV